MRAAATGAGGCACVLKENRLEFLRRINLRRNSYDLSDRPTHSRKL
jgi:hypothetical protein